MCGDFIGQFSQDVTLGQCKAVRFREPWGYAVTEAFFGLPLQES